MMNIFGLAIGLGVIFLAGWGLGRILAGAEHVWNRWELTGLSWVFGTGYVSIALWILGSTLSHTILLAAVASGAIILGLLGRRTRSAPSRAEPSHLVDALLLVLLFAQAVFIAAWAPRLALGWDGLMIWELKARIAFENGGALPASYFGDLHRSWSHPTYPLYFPYNEAWLYLCFGRVDQAWVRVFGPVAYGAAVALLAGGLRRLGSSSRVGLAAAASLFFVPYCFGGAWGVLAGYADFPLAVIFLAAVIHWPILREVSAGEARLFGVAAGLLVWGKSEGMFLWLILAAPAGLLLLWRKRWGASLSAILPGAMLLCGLRAFLGVMKAAPELNYAPVTWSVLQTNAERAGPIVQRFAQELVDLEKWSLLWPGVAAAILALALRAKGRFAMALGAAVILPMCAYGCAYLLSTWSDFELHMELSLSRLLLQLAPVALLTIALAVPAQAAASRSESSKTGGPPEVPFRSPSRGRTERGAA